MILFFHFFVEVVSEHVDLIIDVLVWDIGDLGLDLLWKSLHSFDKIVSCIFYINFHLIHHHFNFLLLVLLIVIILSSRLHLKSFHCFVSSDEFAMPTLVFTIFVFFSE